MVNTVYLGALDAFFQGRRDESRWANARHMDAPTGRAYAGWVVDELPAAAAEGLALVGDSWAVDMAGVTAERLAARFGHPVPLATYPRPGARIGALLPFVREACAAEPRVCVIQFGANDVASPVPLRWTVAQARRAAAICQRAGVLCVIPGVPPVGRPTRVARLDDALRAAVSPRRTAAP